MKRWQIVYGLPLEVWVEIFSFPWITREEFGQLVDKIGNFKFAEHAQFFLHEWGKRTLSNVYFVETGMYKYVHRRGQHPSQSYLDIPQTPLPENIKYFGLIQIRHFDARVMTFLGQIRPLLTDVNIDMEKFLFSRNQTLIPTILGHLTPMLDGIHSMGCEELMIPRIRQFCET